MQVINFLESNNVDIVSLTFDGHKSNIGMCKLLGVSFELENFTPWFTSLKGNLIYVLLDIVHMMKLLRNNLEAKKVFFDGNGDKIMWSYFTELNKIQNSEGVHLGNRLTDRHINFKNEKMKVFLVTQLFSNSVADAMSYLAESSSPEHTSFKDSDATAKFTKMINNIFDIFNSKSFFGKGYKAAISRSNCKRIFEYLSECKDYLKNIMVLQDDEKCSVYDSAIFTGFLGFLIAIENFENIFNTYVLKENDLKYVCTYKLSQDHLETFFSVIRCHGGYVHNPSCLQFYYIYRKLLVNKKVKAGDNGNCQDDETDIICTEPFIDIGENNDEILKDDEQEFSQSFDNNLKDVCISEYVDDVVKYISGFVQKSILKQLTCNSCKDFIKSSPQDENRLITHKKYGDWAHMVKPNEELYRLCLLCEKIFRTEQNTQNIYNRNYLITKVMRYSTDLHFFNDLNDHILDLDVLDSHIYFLMKSISTKYFTARSHHFLKLKNLATRKKIIRAKLNNLIKFNNQ